MELRFFGATGTTTGSCHMIVAGGYNVLLDCGFYQGRREESYERNSRCAFDPKSVHAVVQSHAHVDHSGKLPMLVRQGFAGRIHATSATRDLCDALLRDSAHIMVSDARFLNERRARRAHSELAHASHGERSAADAHGSAPNGNRNSDPEVLLPAHEIVPLYVEEHVAATMRRFVDHAHGDWFQAAPNMRFRLHEAGHILGATWIEGEIQDELGTKRLVFTGDYGRKHQPILRDPEPLLPADVFISESTYGNRVHPPMADMDVELAAAVNRLAARGRGRLLIPAFAVGRTQNVLYSLSEIYRRKEAPPIDIVVDSPLATLATRIVLNHHECFDDEALRAYERMESDASFRSHLRFTDTVDESKALNTDPRPLIIVSASGMMETGRILHHLAWNIDKPETEILVVGFQADHTLGRKLVQGAREVYVLGMRRTVRARITSMQGFSAHADKNGLIEALEPHASTAKALFLVHGEEDQRKPLGRELATRGFRRVEQPTGPEAYRV
jgi:metallo-beta-lactamase family protein